MHFFYQIHTHELFACRSGHMAYTPHIHAQLEMMYVTKGAMDVTIGEQSTRLYAGDLAVIFPHCPHSFEMLPLPESDETEEEVIVLVLNPRLTGDFSEQIISHQPSAPFLRREQLTGDMIDAIHRLLDQSELLYPERFQPTVAKSYAQLLIAWLWPLLHVVPNANASLHSATFRVIQYMMQHFKEPISLESTAAALGISTRQLTRLFSKTMHIGFHEYLLDLRNEYAKVLLRSTKLPITDIAFQAGFESQRTFNRTFRQFYGMTPREYRKSLSMAEGESP